MADSNFSVSRVNWRGRVWKKRIIDRNCNVEALLAAKHAAIVKVVLFCRLNNINALLGLKYVNFVACVDKNAN